MRDNPPMGQVGGGRKPIEVIEEMVGGLNEHVIDGQGAWWHPNARWRGPAGAGLCEGLAQFQDRWQRPFLEAFPDKRAHDLIRVADDRYVAAAGYQEATHSGTFMGVPATGRRVRVRYMDFWEVEDGRIVDNWVLLDLVDLLRQMGVDPLAGKGMDGGQWQPGTPGSGGCAWPGDERSGKEGSDG